MPKEALLADGDARVGGMENDHHYGDGSGKKGSAETPFG